MSHLSDVAAALTPGTFGQLNARDDASDFGPRMLAGLGQDPSTLPLQFWKGFDFASKAVYDPHRRRVYYKGGAHATWFDTHTFPVWMCLASIYYDIATNKWGSVPFSDYEKSFGLGSSGNTHKYNLQNYSATRRKWMESDVNTTLRLSTLDTEKTTPNLQTITAADYVNISTTGFTPPLNSYGSHENFHCRRSTIFVTTPATGGDVWELRDDGTWHFLFTHPDVMTGVIARYNRKHRCVVILGGSQGTISNRRVYRVNAASDGSGNATWTRLADLPAGVPHVYAVKAAHFFADPASGDNVLFTQPVDPTNAYYLPSEGWTHNPTTDVWTRRTDLDAAIATLGVFGDRGTETRSSQSLFDTLTVDLLDEGVTLFIGATNTYVFKLANVPAGVYDGSYPIATVDDETDAIITMGLTYTDSQKPNNWVDPLNSTYSNPSYNFDYRAIAVHDDMEADQQWLWTIQWLRSSNLHFKARSDVWTRFMSRPNLPYPALYGFMLDVGTEPAPCNKLYEHATPSSFDSIPPYMEILDHYACDRVANSADHFFGWGAFPRYRALSESTVLTAINTLYAPEVMTLYDPATTPAPSLPTLGYQHYTSRAIARHLAFAVRMAEFNPISQWIGLRDRIVNIVLGYSGIVPVVGGHGAFPRWSSDPDQNDDRLGKGYVDTTSFTPTTTQWESLRPLPRGVNLIGQTGWTDSPFVNFTVQNAQLIGGRMHWTVTPPLPAPPINGASFVVRGQHAAGGGVNTSYQLAELADAMFLVWMQTKDPRIKTYLLNLADFYDWAGIDSVYGYAASIFGVYADGTPWHIYSHYTYPVVHHTWPCSYTIAVALPLTIGYKLTGYLPYLEKARYAYKRGTQGDPAGGSWQTWPIQPTVCHHFADTMLDGSKGLHYFDFNQQELPFLNLLFENGGFPKVETETPVAPGVPPQITSLNPTTGTQGTIVNVTVAGTGLDGGFMGGAPLVAAVGSGITVQNPLWTQGASTMTVDFLISISAAIGIHYITVQTDDGISNQFPFTVDAQVAPVATKDIPIFLLSH